MLRSSVDTVSVVVGEYNIDMLEKNEKKYEVSHIYNHQNYSKVLFYAFFNNQFNIDFISTTIRTIPRCYFTCFLIINLS